MSINIGQNNKIKNCQIARNSNGVLEINGEQIPYPFAEARNITMINGKVFVDGYEWKDGVWKKTLRAMWYKWF